MARKPAPARRGFVLHTKFRFAISHWRNAGFHIPLPRLPPDCRLMEFYFRNLPIFGISFQKVCIKRIQMINFEIWPPPSADFLASVSKICRFSELRFSCLLQIGSVDVLAAPACETQLHLQPGICTNLRPQPSPGLTKAKPSCISKPNSAQTCAPAAHRPPRQPPRSPSAPPTWQNPEFVLFTKWKICYHSSNSIYLNLLRGIFHEYRCIGLRHSRLRRG